MKMILSVKGLKRIVSVLMVLLLVFGQSAAAFAVSDASMSKEDIIKIIEDTARRKNIPPQILTAIAWKESRFTQFTSSGAPFVSRGNRGLMQINSVHTEFDGDRILNDVTYNIEAGADILLSKWLDHRTPVVGNRDPNVLEHWYFALWAYNGWLSRNNPNLHGEKTYQDGIFDYIRTNYGQEVSTVDWHYIPASGLTEWGSQLPEPAVTHEAGILFYQPDDRALVDVRDHLYVQTHPGGGDVRFSLTKDEKVTILSQPQLVDGLYWYEIIHPATGQKGWVAAIYLKPVFVQQEAVEDALGALLLDPDLGTETLKDDTAEDLEDEEVKEIDDEEVTEAKSSEKRTIETTEETTDELIKTNDDESEESNLAEDTTAGINSESKTPVVSTFRDMTGHPAQEAVDTLAALDVISSNSGDFKPYQTISRQELVVMLDSFFQLDQRGVTSEEMEAQLEACDDTHLIGAWSSEAMARAAVLGVISGYPDGTIRPQAPATREQGMVMLAKAMEGRVLEDDICATKFFEDGDEINAWALPSVNVLLDMGVFDGVDSTSFNPRQELTRAEVAVILYRTLLLQK